MRKIVEGTGGKRSEIAMVKYNRRKKVCLEIFANFILEIFLEFF